MKRSMFLLSLSRVESFSYARKDFLQGCNGEISHMSPKIMQVKRAWIMDIIARVLELVDVEDEVKVTGGSEGEDAESEA